MQQFMKKIDLNLLYNNDNKDYLEMQSLWKNGLRSNYYLNLVLFKPSVHWIFKSHSNH